MTRTRSSFRLLALALGALVVLAAAAAARSATGPSRTVRPHPFAAGHVLGPSLAFPPDTAYCLAHLFIACYEPKQYQKAYNLQPLYDQGWTGAGRTIVIVDAFGSPTIQKDLDVFSEHYGLPKTHVDIITPAGPIPPWGSDPDMDGWAIETALDVEMAHAIAPLAHILLVETPVAETEGVQGFPEMMAAENYVINHNLGDVITQSFGATENTFPDFATGARSLLNLRGAFKNAERHRVTVLAASGDNGSTDWMFNGLDLYPMQVNSWPSADPLVTSIGGTQMHLDAAGRHLSPDVTWNDCCGASGGGPSHVFSRPGFQDGVRSVVGSSRGTPDISMSAAVDGAAILYYTTPARSNGPWHINGGTSEASPIFAGIVAIADQMAGERLGNLNQRLYEMGPKSAAHGIVDITIGDNDIGPFTNSDGKTYHVPGFPALVGYDMATGWGTIDAARFVPALAGQEGDQSGGGN